MADKPRRYTMESGHGRIDAQGIEWFACDPYPYWYRYDENDKLVELGFVEAWAEITRD